MTKPYFKHKSFCKKVEVEKHGIINLADLPIRVYPEKKGYYEIGWVESSEGYVLSEYGGSNLMSFGGMELDVLREIK